LDGSLSPGRKAKISEAFLRKLVSEYIQKKFGDRIKEQLDKGIPEIRKMAAQMDIPSNEFIGYLAELLPVLASDFSEMYLERLRQEVDS